MPLAADVKEEEEGVEREGEEGPDVKADLPLHVSLAKDVMERCVHLLSHPDMGVRLKVESVKPERRSVPDADKINQQESLQNCCVIGSVCVFAGAGHCGAVCDCAA